MVINAKRKFELSQKDWKSRVKWDRADVGPLWIVTYGQRLRCVCV